MSAAMHFATTIATCARIVGVREWIRVRISRLKAFLLAVRQLPPIKWIVWKLRSVERVEFHRTGEISIEIQRTFIKKRLGKRRVCVFIASR